MKNGFLYILILLCFVSCNSKLQGDKKEEKQKPIYYIPKLNPVSKGYIDKVTPSIDSFYTFILGKNFNGMFLVAKNGKVIYERTTGFLNYEEKKELTSKTPIHIASISKVTTALAIMRLVELEQIDLEDDIKKYIPMLPYKGISVRMLMNHRSGIPYYGYFTHGIWYFGNYLKNKDLPKLLKKHHIQLNTPANTRFSYCNTNYALLALIIEKVTKKKFKKAIHELVFKPLRMYHSFILDNPRRINRVSPSYNSRFIKQKTDFLDGIYGDKNMYSTAEDLLKLDLATYDTNFISTKNTKQIFKGYSYEKAGTRNYGLGYRMVEEEGKKSYFFHTGWWHGNTGCYSSLRADTITIIALSNVYTRSVYQTYKLANKLGENYPF